MFYGCVGSRNLRTFKPKFQLWRPVRYFGGLLWCTDSQEPCLVDLKDFENRGKLHRLYNFLFARSRNLHKLSRNNITLELTFKPLFKGLIIIEPKWAFGKFYGQTYHIWVVSDQFEGSAGWLCHFCIWGQNSAKNKCNFSEIAIKLL